MNKLQSLRQVILAADIGLARNPDRLIVAARDGKIVSHNINSLGFEYQVSAEVIITDVEIHIDQIMIPILAWAKVNEPEMFERQKRGGAGIQIETEILDSSKVDLLVRIPIVEAVVVTLNPDGQFVARHLEEQPPQDVLTQAQSVLTQLIPVSNGG